MTLHFSRLTLNFADVVLRVCFVGRGMPYQKHPGNTRMHRIVEKHKDRYNSARRHDKADIITEVIELIQNCSNERSTTTTEEDGGGGDDNNNGGAGGVDVIPTRARFLQRSGTSNDSYWIEQSKERAFNKVGHALRGKKLPYGDVKGRRSKYHSSKGGDHRRDGKYHHSSSNHQQVILDEYAYPISESERSQRLKLLEVIARLETKTLQLIVREFIGDVHEGPISSSAPRSPRTSGLFVAPRSPHTSGVVVGGGGTMMSDSERSSSQRGSSSLAPAAATSASHLPLHQPAVAPAPPPAGSAGLSASALENGLTASLLSSLIAPSPFSPLLTLPGQVGLAGDISGRLLQDQLHRSAILQQQLQQQTDLSNFLALQLQQRQHPQNRVDEQGGGGDN